MSSDKTVATDSHEHARTASHTVETATVQTIEKTNEHDPPWLGIYNRERLINSNTPHCATKPTPQSIGSTPTSVPTSTSWNDDPRPYVWTKATDQILTSIGNYWTKINDPGH
ncbi:ISMsm2 transposase [Mycobacteroides abscessus subsp. abscessus]|nr:hypothetical protein K883_03942 [Mycobacterium sp. TKK-01-0059]SHY37569.1 ISMsm2 transposase [Mycobacteroides abscessus subsp. abscessus]KEF96265.1 hypothetical protein K883_03936 [Mycobacterium sp. TKK-01-0059]SHY74904.1 ISMsm2 transposase [Mycobacteroides abscessus subsp. abscessus]SIC66838.1 ISMsm2 transposase [Mycobacteroides abscessus subsp. abscessus]